MKKFGLLLFVSLLSASILVFAPGCAKKAQVPEEEVSAPAPMARPAPMPAPAVTTDLSSVMLADIHFDFDKFSIRPDARDTLQKDYAAIGAVSSPKLLVEGHCDERGSVEYNLALGQRRADAAMQYLVTLGMDAASLSTISYGKEKPLDSGHTEAAWAKNRRAHFVLTGGTLSK
jgi:peptidoglycan-associated lipoprotein